jgi:hypothetical protein
LEQSRAIALGNLALSPIRQSKLDEAAATLHRTIDVVPVTRGGGGRDRRHTCAGHARERQAAA